MLIANSEAVICMLFVTNRRLSEGARSKAGRRVDFDLADNDPSASLFFCARHAAGEYEELLAPSFLSRLRQSARRQILFFVHGFNCLPERSVFPDALQLQALFDAQAPETVEVVPLVWPCDDDFGLLKDYWDDQSAAAMSGIAFARVIGKFIDWRDRTATEERCRKQVSVLAHSMGNLVLRDSICRWAHDYGAPPAFFRNLFLVAADLANDTLETGQQGAVLAEATRNLIVYHAYDDLALRTSKVVNLRNHVVGRRLGHTGPRDIRLTPRNVYALDCDAFNGATDPFGHSYFLADRNGRPTQAFDHILATMLGGDPPLVGPERRATALAEALAPA
jgi:esterase/lipase superfamily enzyme